MPGPADWSDPTDDPQDDPADDGAAGGTTDVGAGDEQGVTLVRGERRPSVRTGRAIPSNILAEVRAAAKRSGVPEWVLIAVMQRENSSFNPKAKNVNSDGSVDHGLTQINDRWRINDFADKAELVACAESVSCSIDYLAHSVAGTFRSERAQQHEGAPEGDEVLWLNAAANWHRSVRDEEWADYRQGLVDLTERGYTPSGKKAIAPSKEKGLTAAEKRLRTPSTIQDIYDLFDEFLGRPPEDDAEAQGHGRVGAAYGTLRAEFAASPEAALWRRYGPRIKDAHRWADRLWSDYLGHSPTNAELRAAIDNRWDEDRAEAWLRSQPYRGTTLGALRDVRRLADSAAQKHIGRGRADEGELNWLIENGKTSPEDVAGFYEQLKERRDTGDPAFAWVGNPETWRQTRDVLQSLWTNAGLKGKIDPHLVNQAQSGNWSIDDMRERIDGLPAPGFQNVSVGEANRVRKIAQGFKNDYLPGESLTHEEMAKFVGMNSDEINTYYRSLPVELHRAARDRQRQVAQVAQPATGQPVSDPQAMPSVDTQPKDEQRRFARQQFPQNFPEGP